MEDFIADFRIKIKPSQGGTLDVIFGLFNKGPGYELEDWIAPVRNPGAPLGGSTYAPPPPPEKAKKRRRKDGGTPRGTMPGNNGTKVDGLQFFLDEVFRHQGGIYMVTMKKVFARENASEKSAEGRASDLRKIGYITQTEHGLITATDKGRANPIIAQRDRELLKRNHK